MQRFLPAILFLLTPLLAAPDWTRGTATGRGAATGRSTTGTPTQRPLTVLPLNGGGRLPGQGTLSCGYAYRFTAGEGGTWTATAGTGYPNVTVTAGTGATSTETPFRPAANGDLRLALSNVTVTSAPSILAGNAVDAGITTMWDANHTIICGYAATNANGSDSSTAFSHGAYATDGVFLELSSSSAICRWAVPGDQAASASTDALAAYERWNVHSCRLNGTTGTARSNGTQGTVTVSAVTLPTNRNLFFGTYSTSSYDIRGDLAWCDIYPCALTDAEVTHVEQLFLGTGYEDVAGLAANQDFASFTRATVARTQVGSTLYAYGSGAPRVTPDGYMAEPSATNSLLQSRDLSAAAWTKTTATCTLTATGVDGTSNSASTCTANAANATITQGITASGSRSTSMYLRRNTGVGTIEVRRDSAASWTDVSSSVSYGTWFRVTPETHAALTSSTTNPTIGIRIGTNGDAFDVDFVQDESGNRSTSPIPTTTATVTRNADTNTLANTLTSSDSNWCWSVTARPAIGTDWSNPGSNRRLLHIGTYAAANSATLWVDTAGLIYWDVYDSTGTLKRVATATEPTAGSRRYKACTEAGTMALYIDGTSSGTGSGAGTGVISTMPSTVVIGNDNTGSVAAFSVLSSVQLCAGTNATCP